MKERRLRRVRTAAALLAAAGWALSVIAPAGGGWPGRNGLIAFVSDRDKLMLGEVYTVSLGSGRVEDLTHDWLEQLAPVVSPSGKWIAYRSYRAVYVMRRDGTGRRKIATLGDYAPDLSWSPNGKLLALTLTLDVPSSGPESRNCVLVVSVSGGKPRSVGDCSASRPASFAWSPDSRRLALAGVAGLVVVDAGGGGRQRVLFSTPAMSPSWSPDGRRIAFIEGRDSQTSPNPAKLVAATGGPVRSLAADAEGIVWSPDSSRAIVYDGGELLVVSADASRRRWIVQPGFGEVELPRWLPGGRSLLYVYTCCATRPELRQVDADGRRNRLVARLPYSPWSLSLTPDGASAIVGIQGDASVRRLYTMAPDGTRPERLPVGEDVASPAWSPDGLRLAFWCGRRLCVSGSDGRERRRLAAVRRDYNGSERLSWSPDGTRIVYSVKAKGLVEIRALGGTARKVPGTRPGDSGGVWSPDGSRIAYEANRSVTVSLRDGTRTVTIPSGELYADHPEWSPDGRSLVVAKEYNAECPRLCPPYGLVIFSAEGELVRELTGPDDFLAPAWSPDGRTILHERGSQLWSIGVAGSRAKQLQSFGAGIWSDSSPAWQPVCTRFGTNRGENLTGTPGRDLLCGRGGDDDLVGGPGEDRLFGHEGDDRIDARDGGFDVVGCGPGRDTVQAGRIDLVSDDCEHVKRTAGG